MLWVLGSGRPARLIVGGLHGSEGAVTGEILASIKKRIDFGTAVICNLSVKSPYISTLRPLYYRTPIGRKLLYLIRWLKPEVYLELHAYGIDSYRKLTDGGRLEKRGVPPMIKLEGGILLGSISPFLRLKEFRREDLCLTLEAPSGTGWPKALLTDLIDITMKFGDRFEILREMHSRFPMQIEMAIKNFEDFYGEENSGRLTLRSGTP